MPSSTFFNLPEEKRQKCLKAARLEFSRVPYADVSINKIIQAAEIPRGSFYMYFDGKEDLFLYLMGEYAKKLIALLDRLLEEHGGNVFDTFLALFDFLRQGGTGPARDEALQEFLTILRLNAELHSGGLISSIKPEAFLQSIFHRVDTSKLNLQKETDLQDIFYILITFSMPAFCAVLLSDNPSAIRARYRSMLDILKRGMEKASK